LKTPRGLLGAIGRPVLLVCGLTAFLLVVAVACIGGDDDDQPAGSNRNNVDVVVSTFTPTVEGATPPANATRDARETAVAATATWVAENPPPPPPTRDPNATMIPQPTIDPEQEDSLRPPFTWLTDGVNQMYGVFGSYGIIDEERESYANVTAPFYDVGDVGLDVVPGGQLEFILQDDVDTPTSMTVSVYDWEENSAIPTGTDGSIGSHLWFVPRTEPVSTTSISLDDPTFAMPALPDRYVVLVELRWPHDDRLPDPVQYPLFANYAFTIHVQ
jgi:hypothetical protein